MLKPSDSLDLGTLRRHLATKRLTPARLVEGILERIERRGDDKVWIHVLSRDQLLARAAELERADQQELPLYGIPFAIKDNIDLAGHPTTAACPEYRYVPGESAPVVQRLLDAGAIPIGKTNLDQFATGLVGTRSPYGACQNPFDPRYISGGSSSGSAVAVAAGLATFSLGTDTAGSGRVPAAFNNIVGLKPSRGALSSRGLVPACRSLDCISIFALTCEDAGAVFRVASGFDVLDPFSRRIPYRSEERKSVASHRIGVPRAGQLEFFGDEEAARLFAAAMSGLERLGGQLRPIEFGSFLKAARLLYEGPWIAERYLAVREFIERRPQALLPVTRETISAGSRPSAAECFAAQHRLMELIRESETVWEEVDLVATPTAGTIYTMEQIERDPVQLNNRLGHYTNFMNLLDLSAIAVPAGFYSNRLPFGITLFAPAFCEQTLCALGELAQRALVWEMGATGMPLPPARRSWTFGLT